MSRSRLDPKFHVALLAGGSGTRFWPMSRAARPKQLLALTGGRPLLVETWRRMRRLVPASRLWVVAPASLTKPIRRLLPELRADHLVVEPSPRDTGPAVGLACAAVSAADPQATLGIFPTDHIVADAAAFERSVRSAVTAAKRGSLVCLGVQPDRPATGFGYLRCAARPKGTRPVTVERFVEKPDAATARRFLRSGRYLWNAGMFVWKVERFLEELGRTAPAILKAVQSCVAGDRRAWGRATRLSVDYAVMEKAVGVQVVPLNAGWDDLGSWDAAGRLREAAGGRVPDQILVESEGSVVFGSDRLVAVVGVPGVAVIDTPDALLVVARGDSEKVKAVVDELRRSKRKKLL